MPKKEKFGRIRTKFVRNLYEFRTNFTETSVFTHLPHTFARTKFIRISYELSMNLTEFSHLVHRDCRVLRKILPNSTGFPPHTMPCGDGVWPKEPLHLVADRTRRRRLQDLQKVSRGLTAPHSVTHLPDTGQIVLTPETRVTRGVQPEPNMEERLIMAVW